MSYPKTAYLNGQPVTVIDRENRREVWVEKADGTILRVYESGLCTTQPAARPVRLTRAPYNNRFHGVGGTVNGPIR